MLLKCPVAEAGAGHLFFKLHVHAVQLAAPTSGHEVCCRFLRLFQSTMPRQLLLLFPLLQSYCLGLLLLAKQPHKKEGASPINKLDASLEEVQV